MQSYITASGEADAEEIFSIGVDGFYSTNPKDLSDGTLYRVTIEKVGVVRTTKEVEMDGEGS